MFIYLQAILPLWMGAYNFFESISHLEPICESCKSKIDYGVTTRYDDDKGCHICLNCGSEIR